MEAGSKDSPKRRARMRRIGFVILATMLVLGTAATVSWSMGSGKSSQAETPETLRLVIPASGFVVTQSSDLNIFDGRVDTPQGDAVGRVRGSCVVIQGDPLVQECTLSLLLTGLGQISLVGPSYNPAVHPSFRMGIAAGTRSYKTARGQARLDVGTSGDISVAVRLFR
jgi:hypothetical protein